MNYITLLEKQLKPLLKFAFLYVGDIEEAKAILQRSIKKSTKVAQGKMDEKEAIRHLTEEVLRQCHRYSKSFTYNKDSALKFLGIKWYDSPYSAWRCINKLPKAIREVAISYFILNLTSMEMAKFLNIPPGHVSLYLKRANEKLGIVKPDGEQKFIQDLHRELFYIDELELTKIIQNAQIQPKSEKPRYLKWSITFVGIVILLITIVVFGNEEVTAPSEQTATTHNDSQKDSDEGIGNENDSTIDGANEKPIINTSFEPRVLEDISFKIAAYEVFYYYSYFSSAKEAKKQAADQLYRYISAIEFANERNIYLNESEQRAVERQNESTIKSLKYFPTEEKYLNNVLETFQITEEQYIEYFVNLGNEYYVYYDKMVELNVNLDTLDQKLYFEETPAAFYEKAGITLDEVKEIEKSWEQTEYKEVTERQFNFPFDLTGSAMHIIQLENGQYVFENPRYFGLYSTKYGPFLETYVFARNPMIVNRTSLDDLIAYLEDFNTDYEPNKQLARELIEVYKLLKQSIDWEL